MKKHISLVLAAMLLLVFWLGALPAGAASTAFTVLHYTLDPIEEGGESETGRVLNGMTLPRTPTITYDISVTELRVNGVLCTEDSVRLAMAGEYQLTVADRSNPATTAVYTVTVLPELNISDEQEFTSYPTVVCSNAAKLVLDAGKLGGAQEIRSGDRVTTLGMHTVQVFGVRSDGHIVSVQNCTFYIRACTSERVFDEESGKQALRVTVGEFEDHTVEATLDGTLLEAGSHIVTAVGHHSVTAKLDGEEVTNPHMLPSSEQLTLRVRLQIESFELDEPIYLNLEQWDANFLLNGKEVTGNIRITKNGSHTLTVVDNEGNAISGAFAVLVGDADAFEAVDSVTFQFKNPHHTYMPFVLIPVAATLAVALIFLLKRRRIV